MAITFTASPMSKPDDLSLKASLAWDYFKFNDDETNWFCAEAMDGRIIVTDESRNLNNAFVLPDYTSFLEWLESDATDKLAEDPADYLRACGVVPDNLLSDSVVQALLSTINAAESPDAPPVSAEEKPEPPVAPEPKMQTYTVGFRVEGIYTIEVDAPDPETAMADAQAIYDAENTDIGDLEYVDGETLFVRDEHGNIVYERCKED